MKHTFVCFTLQLSAKSTRQQLLQALVLYAVRHIEHYCGINVGKWPGYNIAEALSSWNSSASSTAINDFA